MPNQNSHGGGHHALAIQGSRVDSLEAVSGLDILGEVVLQAPGPGGMRRKSIACIKWSPGKATVGIGMGKGLYEWMKRSFDDGASVTDGTLAIGDANFKKRSVLAFSDALLTSVTVPRLDGSSTDAGASEIEFEPDYLRVDKGDGSDIRGGAGPKQPPGCAATSASSWARCRASASRASTRSAGSAPPRPRRRSSPARGPRSRCPTCGRRSQ